MRLRRLPIGALLAVALPALLAGQSLKDFEKKVTEFTLPNGMHFLLAERHGAPVVSFHTYVNVGSVDDPSGSTGLAHMFEHMAFKGTPTIGTRNFAAEKKAMDAIEQVYDRLEAERNKGPRADAKKVEALQQELQGVIEKAEEFIEPNEYDRIVESNGGVGMNASTAEDQTQYFYSFPSNRIELWYLLESERFLHPVFREFYKERDVVREERRMRVESTPLGKLLESFLSTAFAAHPYKNPPVGWGSDIDSFRRPEAEAFYKRYYTPANITIGIAGDVDPVNAKKLAEKYFGRLPAGSTPPPVRTIEPRQDGEKRVAVASPAQPYLLVGYQRPDEHSPDDPTLEVLSDVLSGGRTGVIYKELVRDSKIALDAEAVATYPGGKYPSTFVFLVVPSAGHTVEECEKAIDAIVDRARKEKPDQAAIDRTKTKLRANLIHKLGSNSGLAEELTQYYVAYGDWRKLFTELDEYNKITAEDVQKAAQKYLTKETRTVAYTYVPAQASQTEGGQK